jgi:hypothetical protein
VKTFQEFNEAAALAIPAAVRLAPYVLPAIGAAANLMKGAQPRTPNIQRPSPKITAAETQKRQAAADRKAAAKERAEAKAKEGIDSLIGSDAERAEAKKARESQPQIQRRLRQQAMRERMKKAAEAQGLD